MPDYHFPDSWSECMQQPIGSEARACAERFDLWMIEEQYISEGSPSWPPYRKAWIHRTQRALAQAGPRIEFIHIG